MPVSVVVGGQYGSEGKGKVAAWLAKRHAAQYAIRVGGPNSGHTVVDDSGQPQIFRQLPTAVIMSGITAVLGAGSLIDPPVLLDEVQRIGLSASRLWIHPRAVVINSADKHAEINTLSERIASTGSGSGSALVRRLSRCENIRFACETPELKRFVREGSEALVAALETGWLIVEGTQGYGLSVLYGPHYPYVTSRDTTAASFLSESGISPLDVEEIVLVLRCHPIRVGGNSGPLENETSWEQISLESGAKERILERTTVTKTVRRVARFDPKLVRAAITHNRPNVIVLNHLDYLAPSERFAFVQTVEERIGQHVDYVGLGPAEIVPKNALRLVG